MNAEVFQAELRISALISDRTKRSPDWMLPGGCSLEPDGAMKATAGSVPSEVLVVLAHVDDVAVSSGSSRKRL